MASRWDELLAEYDTLGTQDGQAQFLIDRTGFSEECLSRVLVHLNAQPIFGEEGDLEAQARNAGLSVDEYAVAMSPLLGMSVEQAQARLREIKARIDCGDDPGFPDDELEQSKKWEAFVETIASLSGEEHAVVTTILSAVTALNNRQYEIVQELLRLKASGESASGSARCL